LDSQEKAILGVFFYIVLGGPGWLKRQLTLCYCSKLSDVPRAALG